MICPECIADEKHDKKICFCNCHDEEEEDDLDRDREDDAYLEV